MLRTAAVVALITAVASTAAADVVDTTADGATIDWSRGVVTATGVGLADRHAPSPAVGRVASRRRAEDAARGKLAAALAQVPWIAGGSPEALGVLAKRDGWLETRAVVIDATLNPDGSWRVTLGLPIEAIRIGLAGPRVLPTAGDRDAPRAVVIDARVVKGLAPVGGVGIGSATATGTTLWRDRDPPAALVGAKPVRLAATGFTAGVLAVDGTVPDLGGTLIVVVVRRP
jgi:hypothetical protein